MRGGRMNTTSSVTSVLVRAECGCYRYIEMIDRTPGCWLRWREALRILDAVSDDRKDEEVLEVSRPVPSAGRTRRGGR